MWWKGRVQCPYWAVVMLIQFSFKKFLLLNIFYSHNLCDPKIAIFYSPPYLLHLYKSSWLGHDVLNSIMDYFYFIILPLHAKYFWVQIAASFLTIFYLFMILTVDFLSAYNCYIPSYGIFKNIKLPHYLTMVFLLWLHFLRHSWGKILTYHRELMIFLNYTVAFNPFCVVSNDHSVQFFTWYLITTITVNKNLHID